ncbi:MAG: hypothetical protein NVS4B3_00450 [Gemmatimonadaceae bacterium]
MTSASYTGQLPDLQATGLASPSLPPVMSPRGLDALVSEHPELAHSSAILRALIAAMGAIDATLPLGTPNADAARTRLEAGLPALEGESLVEPPRLIENVRMLALHLGAVEGIVSVADAAETLTAMGDRLVDVVHAALSGAWADLGAFAEHVGAEEYALLTLLDYAVRPALQAGGAAVADVVKGTAWSHGRCPVCGAPPVLAELRGKSGERFLRCGRCAASWEFARVGCPYCEAREHAYLSYLHGEGEESHRRAQTCDRCHAYIKELAALDPFSPVALLEIDLATAGLDLVAIERGYHR